MTALRSGELFAGVGGLGMAVDEVFESEPAWFCEVDAAPSKVLAHRYPGVPNYGDVTKVDFRAVPHTDIRCGGFPCTDVSLAGGRKGMKAGTRSGLWSEFARSISEDRPDWVVIENVRGLFTADAAGDVEPCPWCLGDGAEQHTLRALDAVLADLSDLGFDAEWLGLRAADVGAPHGRFRVFILAWPRERTVPHTDRDGLRSLGRVDALGRDADGRRGADGSRPSGESEAPMTLFPTPSVANSHGNDLNGRGEELLPGIARKLLPTPIVSDGTGGSKNIDTSDFSPQMRDIIKLLPTPDAYSGSRGGSQHPDKRRDGGHTVSLADVAEHKLLGTPRVSSGNGAGNLERRQAETNIESQVLLLPTPTASEGEKGGPNQAYGSGGSTLSGTVPHLVDWGVYSEAVHRWAARIDRDVPAPVRFDGKAGNARLNPELTEWMMGWPAGWVTDSTIGLTRSEQLKACGNGVVPQQAAFALRRLLARPGVPAIREQVAA